MYDYWKVYGHASEEIFLAEREKTRKKIAEHSKEDRIRKAGIILGKSDGTTINSKMAYLADFCAIDFTEILQALDNVVQNEAMWA